MAQAPGTGIREMYGELHATYELVNRLMTFGLDGFWRRRAAADACAAGGRRWLDVCTGTGEMAECLARRAAPGTAVFAVDFSLPMLRKALAKRSCRGVAFAAGASGALPFPDGSFDLVTMSFATRNVNASREALVGTFREFHRVLRPGGVFVNLETSRPPARLIRSLLHCYVRAIVRRLGSIISGSRTGYCYLCHTLTRFYGAEELSGLIREAGFPRVSFRRLTWGVVAVHRAVK
jgi:demethylmenaquinone methyltransferase/2-methoxy-6-polyprenyl-1,4-benzoquinol methylase